MELTHFFKPGEIAPGEGAWVFLLKSPLPANLSPAEQITLFYETAYMAVCNDELAIMYGFERAADLIGAPVSTFMPPSNSILELLETMIKSGYQLENAMSKEHDREGKPIYFMNKMYGIMSDDTIIGGKGTQYLIEKPV
jgi:hypothetical protein